MELDGYSITCNLQIKCLFLIENPTPRKKGCIQKVYFLTEIGTTLDKKRSMEACAPTFPPGKSSVERSFQALVSTTLTY